MLNELHGAAIGMSFSSATASISRMKYWLLAPAHGAIAPPANERSGLGTTNSGSTSYTVPRPSQWEQAPYGELKEKLRGASSPYDVPQVGQARCWLKVTERSVPSESTIWISAMPSASRSAVSMESVSRRSTPSRRTRRSTTTEMSCCS